MRGRLLGRLSPLFSVSTGGAFGFGRKLSRNGKKERRGQNKEDKMVMGGRVAMNSLPFTTCKTSKRLLTVLLTLPALEAVIRAYVCSRSLE